MNSLETIIPIIVLIIIGYATKRVGLLKPEDSISLNKIVVNIAIPSLIFMAMYTADLSSIGSLAEITMICLSVGALGGLMGFIFSKIRKYPKKTRWSITVTSAMFNSGFMGYPIVLGVFGAEGLVRAVFYDAGSTIIFIIFGILLLLVFGGKYSTIAKRTLLFPPLWGIILGVSVNLLHLNIGSMAPTILKYLSGAAVPLIMMSLGLSLEMGSLKNYVEEALAVSGIKLILAPLVALLMVSILGLSGLNSQVTVTEAAMPSAMLALVLAITYELDVKAAGACIFLSTVFSMVTLPIIMALI
ncbi:AEC family transporter [Methanobacterium paludis]|uniref:Auxin Efflux Carrier n=1 Tax=Methanobacterium paludis (strain DSM 25820 / JCM 18151 / SWAN1) TaxID=868131 RepID=F6D5H1_METPW|nr:AEC family transporter [Methanobacterium paludis]AEG19323.1 Auxin Efflux Carrier [Methanobacterium paludis]